MSRSLRLFAVLACAALFVVATPEAQTICRWDGTAPYCAGSCNLGETEEAQVATPTQAEAFDAINSFGNTCIFGSKALCCSDPGVSCRWDGTAPFCDGECDDDEEEVKRCKSCIGHSCWTGSKAKCCKPQTGSTGQPLEAGVGAARYAAVWEYQPTGPAWIARHGMTSAEYQSEFNDLGRKGYRLLHVAGYGVGVNAYYAAIWEQSPGPPQIARHGLTPAEYQIEFDNLVAAGYRLVQVSGYAVNGDAFYAGIWEQSSGPPWIARHGMSAEEYQQQFDQWTSRGYRLVKVSGFGLDGEEHYAAIWELSSGPAWEAHHGMTNEDYQNEFNLLGQAGYRVVHLSAFSVDGDSRFAAIWEQVSGPAWSARHGMTSDKYQEEFNYHAKDDFRLRVVSGYHAY